MVMELRIVIQLIVHVPMEYVIKRPRVMSLQLLLVSSCIIVCEMKYICSECLFFVFKSLVICINQIFIKLFSKTHSQ